jgi:drug/metabolite transporter (DMT)-like permease
MAQPLLVAAALACFAANSLLCRMALSAGQIDAATFTAVRLLAGAVTLAGLSGQLSVLAAVRSHARGALALVLYAVPFSFAYVALGAGTGAFILFGTVQLTMIGAGVARRERLAASAWAGLALALGGLLFLTATRLSLLLSSGALWMMVAGVGWAIYTLLGRGAADPLRTTAANFMASVPVALGLLALGVIQGVHMTARGLILATISGALASGVGYSLWYAALRGLRSTSAAVLQLLVPVLAASAGVIMLGEIGRAHV